MSAYQPPFHITNQMLMYVSSVSEKIGEINVIRNMEAKPHLRKNNRIKSIHSSLKIEANSLSLEQVRDVIDGHIVLGEQKEIQEVKNAYAAYEKLEAIDPYSMKDLKKFHGIMTKYTVEESGDFRKGEEGVFDGDKCIFMAPPAWNRKKTRCIRSYWLLFFIMNLFSSILLLMGTDEWHGCGTRRCLQNGNRFLLLSRLKARLKNFRKNTTGRSRSATKQVIQICLLNLC